MLPGMIPFNLTHRVIVPGTSNFTSPGTFSFEVPDYDTLTVSVSGGGGGGSTSAYNTGGDNGEMINGQSGGSGDASRFRSSVDVVGGGGGGGIRGYWTTDPGWVIVPARPGSPGTASGGDENKTGGGANGGGNGGAGGLAVKTWALGDRGAPVPGETITVVVGNGGSGARILLGRRDGKSGSIAISWA